MFPWLEFKQNNTHKFYKKKKIKDLMGQAKEKKKKFWIPPNPQILAPHPYLRHMQVLNERPPIQRVFVFKSTRRKTTFRSRGEGHLEKKKKASKKSWQDEGATGQRRQLTRIGGDGALNTDPSPLPPFLDFGFSRCCTNKLWCFLSKTQRYIKRC